MCLPFLETSIPASTTILKRKRPKLGLGLRAFVLIRNTQKLSMAHNSLSVPWLASGVLDIESETDRMPDINQLCRRQGCDQRSVFSFRNCLQMVTLTAQSRGLPSAFERNTSDGISRTVVVIGAMVTSPRNSRAELRVRIKTGLFLSGG